MKMICPKADGEATMASPDFRCETTPPGAPPQAREKDGGGGGTPHAADPSPDLLSQLYALRSLVRDVDAQAQSMKLIPVCLCCSKVGLMLSNAIVHYRFLADPRQAACGTPPANAAKDWTANAPPDLFDRLINILCLAHAAKFRAYSTRLWSIGVCLDEISAILEQTIDRYIDDSNPPAHEPTGREDKEAAI